MGTLPWLAKLKKGIKFFEANRLLTETSHFTLCSSKGEHIIFVQANMFSFHIMSILIDKILGFNVNNFSQKACPSKFCYAGKIITLD